MNRRKIRGIAVLVLAAATAGAEPSVTLNQVQPRYPWNGYVDIDYTVSGLTDGEYATDYRLEFSASGNYGGAAFSVSATNFLGVAWCDLPITNGTHRITWDSAADGANFAGSTTFKFEVVYDPVTEKDADYIILDLTAGSGAAARYPVRYVRAPSAPPAAFNHDEYKCGKTVLKRVGAGTFRMGNCNTLTGTQGSGDTNWHTVQLTKDYFLALFPLTVAQNGYLKGSGSKTDMTPKPLSRNAIVGATGQLSNLCAKAVWHGSVAVDGFSLPTEAQWEYAARAGSTYKTYWGTDDVNGTDSARPYHWWGQSIWSHVVVGQRLPNNWGFYDMTGTMNAWCLDLYAAYSADPAFVSGGTTVDPSGPETVSSTNYCYRGGWSYGSIWSYSAVGQRMKAPGNYISANGYLGYTSEAVGDLGLRLAKSVSATAVDSPAPTVKSFATKTVAVDLRTATVRKLYDISELLPIVYNSDTNWAASGGTGTMTLKAYPMSGVDETDPSDWTQTDEQVLLSIQGAGLYEWTPAKQTLWKLSMEVENEVFATAYFNLRETAGVAGATPISEATITVSPTVVYTGAAVLPTVTVVYQGRTLREITDYELAGLNNLHLGEATLVIQGVEDFGGTVERTFQIVPAVAGAVAEAAGSGAVDARTNEVRTLRTRRELLPFAWNNAESFSTNQVCAWPIGGLPAAANAAATVTLAPMAGPDAEPDEARRFTLAADGEDGEKRWRGTAIGWWQARLGVSTNEVSAGSTERILCIERGVPLTIIVR